MSIYSGLPTREDQTNYNKLLSRLISTMQQHILELSNGIIASHFSSKYSKIIAKMQTYEQHKYLPPKFTTLLKPLEFAIRDSYGVKAKNEHVDFGFKLEAVKEEEQFGSPRQQINKYKTEAYIKKSMIKQKKFQNKQYLQTQPPQPNKQHNPRSRSVFSEKKPKPQTQYKYFQKLKARETMGNLNYKRNKDINSSSGQRIKIKSKEHEKSEISDIDYHMQENDGTNLKKIFKDALMNRKN